QVPSCEFFPLEAVQTNIIGSANVVDAAITQGAESVVCLSTDKAVRPINAMGMTKALMEKVAQAATRGLPTGATVVSSVRYGNVMYSRGSVIPLFIDQIKRGVPLTITEPRMTRFMLDLGDAIDLVQFAFENARQGDVFVKKAPACTVGDLAKTLLELFEADNEFAVIGMRHGEKMFETLLTAEELRRAEDLGDFFRVSLDARDLNYAKYFTQGDPEEGRVDDYHSDNARQLTHDELRQTLLSLPEVRSELKAQGRGR
ncbi:MAG: polysaccharide biosynthesis protein, partial [Thermoanaerobaculia bacterium]